MTTTLVLRSAINVKKYRSKLRSPVTPNSEREMEYAQGIVKFFSLVNYQSFDFILLVDNTISSIHDYPQELRKILPESCEIIASNSNKFGKYNKGAGDIETYRYLFGRDKITTKYTVHFEPRLQLSNSQIFERFFKSPMSLLSLSMDRAGIQTGYMFLETSQLRKFCSLARLISLVIKRQSIENHMLRFAKTKKIQILEGYYCSFRIDPLTRNLIEY
jgi:hypothetical protein